MEKIIRFQDSELGEELVKVTCSDSEDFYEKVETARKILEMYSMYAEEYTSEDRESELISKMKKDIPRLTTELFKVVSDILDSGYNGITTHRFCDFLLHGYGWVYESIEPDKTIKIY